MTELEINILRFLLSGSAYSENAVMKNMGIDQVQLNRSFDILFENGYLETYDDFLAREKLNEDECKKSSGGCSSCPSASASASASACGSGGGGCCSQKKIDDHSKVKVLTMKAIDNFY